MFETIGGFDDVLEGQILWRMDRGISDMGVEIGQKGKYGAVLYIPHITGRLCGDILDKLTLDADEALFELAIPKQYATEVSHGRSKARKVSIG